MPLKKLDKSDGPTRKGRKRVAWAAQVEQWNSKSVGAASMNCFLQSRIWLGWSGAARAIMPFADHSQGVIFLENFQDDFQFEIRGEFALAFHGGLNLARYPTQQLVLNMGHTVQTLK